MQYETVLTSDPSISLSTHNAFALDHAHSYLLVRFDGIQVVVTGPNGTPFKLDLHDRNDTGVQNWRINEILQPLEVPGFESYPWADMVAVLPKMKIQSLERFEDRAQQERFMSVTETLLFCVNGVWCSLLKGERQRGQVVWGDTLTKALRSGDLIK